MFKRTIKIQSFTDLITNSSSEAYMYLSFDAVDSFIEILDSMLHLAGYEGSCTDYFYIHEEYESIRIEALDPKNQEIANVLEKVNSLFYVDD